MRRILLLLAPLVAACPDGSTPNCPEGTIDKGGVCRVVCAQNDECLATQVCRDGACQAGEPDSAPTIGVFRAVPNEIMVGERTTLEWATTNADAVEIQPTPGTGLSPLGSVELAGLTETTTFDLVATNAFGSANQSVTVTVRDVNAPLRIQSFEQIFEAGDCDDVTVAWVIAADDTGPELMVEVDVGGTVVFRGSNATGSAALEVTMPQDVRLRVMQGTEQDEATLAIAPGLVCAVETNPPGVLLEGDTATIDWSVRGATKIELYDDTANALLFRNDRGNVPDLGFWLVEPRPPSTRYRLEIFGADGARSEHTIDVPVMRRLRPPVVERFEVRPRIALEGDGVFSVDYTVSGASSIDLIVDGMTTSLSSPSNVVPVMANGSHTIELRASNDDGTVHLKKLALVAQADRKDNGTVVTAQPLQPQMPVGTFAPWVAINGTANGVTGPDFFRFVIPAGVPIVRIQLTSHDAGCVGDTIYAVLSRTNQAVAPTTVQHDVNGCPTYLYENLPGGTFIVEVGAVNETVPYVLSVDPTPPSCGDGVREAFETCDDGNVASGDGCNDSCMLEPEFDFTVTEGASINFLPGGRTVNFASYVGTPGDPNDAGFSPVRFSRPFPLYGRKYAGMLIHRDGFLTFHADYTKLSPPAALPTFEPPNPAVYAFGADLSGGTVTVVTPPTGPLLAAVEWEDSGVDGREQITARAFLELNGSVRVAVPTNGNNTSYVVGIEGPMGLNVELPPSCDGSCSSSAVPPNWSVTFAQ